MHEIEGGLFEKRKETTLETHGWEDDVCEYNHNTL